jgi:hypothetical protein
VIETVIPSTSAVTKGSQLLGMPFVREFTEQALDASTQCQKEKK